MKTSYLPLSLAVAAAALSLQALPAHAQKGDVILRIGVGVVDPKDDNLEIPPAPATVVDVDSGTSATIEGTYMFADRWGVELLAAWPFTHDIEMPQLLPGIAPSGKPVRLAFCVVVGFEDGKVAHEHIYWDQASLLVQVGLLDPAELPVTGAEQADNVLDPRAHPLNRLIPE